MADTIQLFGIGLDTSQASRNASKLNRDLGSLGERSRSVTRDFRDLAGSFGSLAVVGAVGRDVFNTIRSFEQLQAQLKTVTGSTAAAAGAFDVLKDFAARTPFELEDNIQAFIRLKALGIDPTLSTLTDFGNIAAGFGRDLVDVASAVQGAVTGETEALKAFGIISKVAGDQITFSFQGAERTVDRTTDSIVNALREIGRQNFGSAMGDQLDTINAKLSNTHGLWDQLVVAIGSSTTGPIKEGLDFLNTGMENLVFTLDQGSHAAILKTQRELESLRALRESGTFSGKLLGFLGFEKDLSFDQIAQVSSRIFALEVRLRRLQRGPEGDTTQAGALDATTLPHLGPGAGLAGLAGNVNVAGLGRGLGFFEPLDLGLSPRSVGPINRDDNILNARAFNELRSLGEAFLPTQEELTKILAEADNATAAMNRELDDYITKQMLATRGADQLGLAIVNTIGSAFASLAAGGGIGGLFSGLAGGAAAILTAGGSKLAGAIVGQAGGLIGGLLSRNGEERVQHVVVDRLESFGADAKQDMKPTRQAEINIFDRSGRLQESGGIELLYKLQEVARETGVNPLDDALSS